MTKSQRVVKYIKECFDEYSINIKEFFWYDFEEGNYEEIAWINENGDIDPKIISHASEVLGISVDDIISTNEEAMLKWLKKYHYFGNIKPFEQSYEKTFFGPEFDNVRLLEVLFDTPRLNDLYSWHFDYEDVKHRLVDQLKEFDSFLPGTFHPDAQITNLKITTENFCKFDEIEDMANSFIEMTTRAKELFLLALKQSLSDDEINEYNLLVSVLGIRDRFFTKGYLYYSSLIKAKDVYSSVTETNFFDNIVFKHCLDFKPWRCSGFIDNKELVIKYLSVIPQAKGIMRDFAMNVSRFKCYFTWSDAKPITYSPEEEAEFAEIDATLGENPIPVEKRAKEASMVYVKKTYAELDGNEAASEKLLSYCRPVKLGGLPATAISYTVDAPIKRMQSLLGKIESNNFVERMIGRSSSGGNINE